MQSVISVQHRHHLHGLVIRRPSTTQGTQQGKTQQAAVDRPAMPAASDLSPPADGVADISGDEYEWLQAQLMNVGATLAAGGAGDEEEASDGDWADPSTNGVLGGMLEACEDGDADELAQLLGRLSVNVDTPGPDGDCCLHIASLYGSEACVERLLEAGSRADVVNQEDGSTALHDAAAGGFLPVVKMLLARAAGAPAGVSDFVNRADEDGDTPLHNAARGGHLEVVRCLLEHGADASKRNGAGATPADEADEEEIQQALRTAAGTRAPAADS